MRVLRILGPSIVFLILALACCLPMKEPGDDNTRTSTPRWRETLSIARLRGGGVRDCIKTEYLASLSAPKPPNLELQLMEPTRLRLGEVQISDCEVLAAEFPPLGTCILNFEGAPHVPNSLILDVQVTHTVHVYRDVAQAEIDCQMPIATWVDGSDLEVHGASIRRRVMQLRR